MCLGCYEAGADEILVRLRGCDAFHRLLLEDVKHVDGSRERGDVGSPIRVTVMVFDELQDLGRQALPERSGTLWMIAVLGVEQSAEPNTSCTSSGNDRRSLRLDPTKWRGLRCGESIEEL